nr:tetratricopeptide repeat protein [Rickettsia bellii]
MKLRPSDAKAYNNKGNCLYKLGRLEESRIALETAVKLCPDYGIAIHNRNILIRKLGKQYRERVALSIN